MARKKTPTLTEAELRLMQIIWDLGEATVNDVIAALPKSRAPAYNTVLTILRILEQKGYLRRTKAGRAHVYRPVVTREQARKKALRHMLKSLFDDSPEALVISILKNEKLSAREFEGLKKMIEESEQDKG